jgi:hypothetical protein
VAVGRKRWPPALPEGGRRGGGGDNFVGRLGSVVTTADLAGAAAAGHDGLANVTGDGRRGGSSTVGWAAVALGGVDSVRGFSTSRSPGAAPEASLARSGRRAHSYAPTVGGSARRRREGARKLGGLLRAMHVLSSAGIEEQDLRSAGVELFRLSAMSPPLPGSKRATPTHQSSPRGGHHRKKHPAKKPAVGRRKDTFPTPCRQKASR